MHRMNTARAEFVRKRPRTAPGVTGSGAPPGMPRAVRARLPARPRDRDVRRRLACAARGGQRQQQRYQRLGDPVADLTECGLGQADRVGDVLAADQCEVVAGAMQIGNAARAGHFGDPVRLQQGEGARPRAETHRRGLVADLLGHRENQVGAVDHARLQAARAKVVGVRAQARDGLSREWFHGEADQRTGSRALRGEAGEAVFDSEGAGKPLGDHRTTDIAVADEQDVHGDTVGRQITIQKRSGRESHRHEHIFICALRGVHEVRPRVRRDARRALPTGGRPVIEVWAYPRCYPI